MLGAVVGDIVGSVWEFSYQKDEFKNEALITDAHEITDDSILSCATAFALLEGDYDFREHYYQFAKKCPIIMGGYGSGFVSWLADEDEREPYNSCGNGSAMRVSPIGWYAQTQEQAYDLARQSAEVTHNHPEGIKGAQAVALAIFWIRQGADKQTLKKSIESEFGYNLDFNLFKLWKDYQFQAICQETVPQALACFLQAGSFEETMKNVLYIGGDTDTLGAIAGAVAEAYYSIPEFMEKAAYNRLKERKTGLENQGVDVPDDMKNVMEQVKQQHTGLDVIVETFHNRYCTIKKHADEPVKRSFVRTLYSGELSTIRPFDNDLLITLTEPNDSDIIEEYNNTGMYGRFIIDNNYYLSLAFRSNKEPVIESFWEKMMRRFEKSREEQPQTLFDETMAQSVVDRVQKRDIKNVYIVHKGKENEAIEIASFITHHLLSNYELRMDLEHSQIEKTRVSNAFFNFAKQL